jgi:hypothetical protein
MTAETQGALRRLVPFPEFVESALAVYIAPHEYSFRDLVLAVSQQVGSGHEDTSMDKPLMQMRQFVLGGDDRIICGGSENPFDLSLLNTRDAAPFRQVIYWFGI